MDAAYMLEGGAGPLVLVYPAVAQMGQTNTHYTL